MSVANILNKKYDFFDFQGQWADAFGQPERCGVWFIWGNSGVGKTSFTLQLCKELSRFGRVIFNSLEEGDAYSIRCAFEREAMETVDGRLYLVSEPLEDLSRRLKQRRAPDIAVIDSFQYTKMSFKDYLKFKEQHTDKLLVFTSQADGKKPMGRAAVSVMYDAALKIWIEGYTATSKGRYIGPNGGTYMIYDKGSAVYKTSNQ